MRSDNSLPVLAKKKCYSVFYILLFFLQLCYVASIHLWNILRTPWMYYTHAFRENRKSEKERSTCQNAVYRPETIFIVGLNSMHGESFIQNISSRFASNFESAFAGQFARRFSLDGYLNATSFSTVQNISYFLTVSKFFSQCIWYCNLIPFQYALHIELFVIYYYLCFREWR